MTDAHQNEDNGEKLTMEEAPQYGVGPFSIREVALVGTWLVAFVVSFFPTYGAIGVGPSVWSNGIDWLLTIGAPTVAVFLVVLRRLSPQGIRRVGSLGIDQFASVAFSVSTVLWLTILWNSFISLAGQGVFLATWVVWVEFFLMLAGVALTVFAPLIPPFAQDFVGRPEVPAHRNARPARAITARPLAQPASYAPLVDDSSAGAPAAPATPYAPADQTYPGDDSITSVLPADLVTDAGEPAAGAVQSGRPEQEIDATAPAQARQSFEQVEHPSSTVEPAAAGAPQHQAFWALVPEERDVVDEIGIPVFRVGPSAWALVIEDRGEAFVVRHEDGRIGYLHDVSGVTRG